VAREVGEGRRALICAHDLPETFLRRLVFAAAQPDEQEKQMALPEFSMRQLLEAGVHFGHQPHLWNPRMEPFIFGVRNGIHILDLSQTMPLLHQALVKISDVVARGGRVLFVGTKRQASGAIADAAARSAQYYINHRWLGGTLTNWKTVSNSIRRLKSLESTLAGEVQGLTKKELLQMTRQRNKLDRALGGIKDMGGLPDLLFVIDTNREGLAISEARKLKIPVIAVIDTNSDPDVADYPIPGNDDAGRAIALYCDLAARAVIDGIERSQVESGVDAGAAADPVVSEPALEAEAEIEAAADAQKSSAGDAVAKDAAKAETSEGKPASGNGEDKSAPVIGKTDYEQLSAPDGEADDLKLLGGVGPVIEQGLNAIGIYHYAQIAALTAHDIKAVDEALGLDGRLERDGWVEQASRLVADGGQEASGAQAGEALAEESAAAGETDGGAGKEGGDAATD
jgi:small subunit ribosomal protein S2